MTISSRNTLIVLGIAFAAVAAVVTAYTQVSIEYEMAKSNAEIDLMLQVEIFLLVCFSVIASTILFFSFRTTVSAEYFFLILFLVSLSFESFRSVWRYVVFYEYPVEYAAFVTRAVYFGRFCGILFLFNSGLFPAGIEYQKINIFFGVSCLASFVLAFFLAVDTSESKSFLFAVGGLREIVAGWLLIDVLAIISYLTTAYRNNNSRYLFVGIGFFLIITGRNIIFLTHSPVPYAFGFLLLIAGTIVSTKQIRNIYLWS